MIPPIKQHTFFNITMICGLISAKYYQGQDRQPKKKKKTQVQKASHEI